MPAKSKEQLLEEAKTLGIDVSEMDYQEMRSVVAEAHENNKVETEPRVEGEPGGDVETTDSTVDEVIKNAKKLKLSLTTSFRVRTKEGDRLQFTFRGSGVSLEEAIENLLCVAPEEEEGKEFPEDLNMPLNVKVKRGDHEFSRRLAPHVARVTVGQRKNITYLEKLLGLK